MPAEENGREESLDKESLLARHQDPCKIMNIAKTKRKDITPHEHAPDAPDQKTVRGNR
jgi:hypothetical protein